MTSCSLAHRDAVIATVFVGYLEALGRNPDGWDWPTSTAHYLRYRIATLATDLLVDGATFPEVA